jgi:hypothetical protein
MLSACAPAELAEPITGAERVRVTVRAKTPPGAPAAFEISDPARVARLAAFANDRRDGFSRPASGLPPVTLAVSYLRNGERLGTMEAGGAGGSYFILREIEGERVVRPISLQDVSDIARLAGHEADELFQR